MPLFLLLAAPGSTYRRACSLTRLACTLLHPTSRRYSFAPSTIAPCLDSQWPSKSRCGKSERPAALRNPRLDALCTSRVFHATPSLNDEEISEDSTDASLAPLTIEEDAETVEEAAENAESHTQVYRGKAAQASRLRRKAQRQSRPATVLAALDVRSKDMYVIAPPGKKDLSYVSLLEHGGVNRVDEEPQNPQLKEGESQQDDPISLYSILARYIRHHAALPRIETDFEFTPEELDLLTSRNYRPDSVKNWALCLAEPNSRVAAKNLESGPETPPFFLLLLFLRRKTVRVSALPIIMAHVQSQLKDQPIVWDNLKILIIRLTRHARLSWPESMPWIASLFTAEAARLFDRQANAESAHGSLAELTRFCNTFLALLSLPASLNPIQSAKFQEEAQFTVLQYMATCPQAIVVTDLGFRAVARNQLAHAKTKQEREWAEIKGPSWPPWKENRTAMDEDKSYEFGASRASKIIHRMFEAGYSGNYTTDLTQIYAGWDTDASPTIQTRTSAPRFQDQQSNLPLRRALLWAGRIRTTRTTREAWACFLSHEQSEKRSHETIYHAMFAKLSRGVVERAPARGFQPESNSKDHETRTTHLLPGDMLEVLPDPVSPLHDVFLTEPVPTYKELLRRMQAAGVRPSGRSLAFLLETCPDFETGLEVIELAKYGPDAGIARLAAGNHFPDNTIRSMPAYLFSAFIGLLCRFGQHLRPLFDTLEFCATQEEHQRLFLLDRRYLLDYAHMLLMHYTPRYRPSWIIYLARLVKANHIPLVGNVTRYRMVCKILDRMDELDLEVDDEILSLVCTATAYTLKDIELGRVSPEDARHLLDTSSARLRTLFNELVLANLGSYPAGMATLPIARHIPGPASLHAYVRVLGLLRDYEGLYSFSTWLTKYHVEVTDRAEAQHSGSKLLFRTIVALRDAVDGTETRPGAPADIAQLIRMQMEGVEAWGGWPEQKYVDLYRQGRMKSARPVVGGR
ncbi:hypothetical protein NX059_003125 [Plenodomus lindquistii]|nr:hypothetical protein NX059_003125 [Plenodomus lindquistii]